jgi:tRNA(adenine34) deaminase
MDDRYYMEQALALAREAAADGEVPVGCVIVRGEEIVGRGRNRREKDKTALAHAEIEAIGEACRTLGGWRLWECTLYVTLEPCAMCAGAIINARIKRVVYGASDSKFGACRSVCSLFDMAFNHHPQVESGVLEEEVVLLMKEFFRNLRMELKTRPKWRPKSQP